MYADQNNEFWPNPASGIGDFDYVGQIGKNRAVEHPPAYSTTRAFWMLIRAGTCTTKLLKCPSSNDKVDDTEDVQLYYDFQGYEYVSYGYQVPFGQRNKAVPRENCDPGMPLAADKGPYSQLAADGSDALADPGWITARLRDPPEKWQPWNSPNHGGRGQGEGQNILFADGHVRFHKRPCLGVDDDNIYTQGPSPRGNAPGRGIFPGADYPMRGQNSPTDSLIYP